MTTGYNPSKEEVHALAEFSKEAMTKEYKNVNKEMKNFENMSMSGNKAGKLNTDPGLAKKCECFMANHDVNLATKSNKFKFKSRDECLNNLFTMHTYLKGQYNKNKRQHTKPTKLVPISFVELKRKQEKEKYVFLKALFDSGTSSTLVSQAAVRHLKKTNTVFSIRQQEFFQPTEKSLVKIKFP